MRPHNIVNKRKLTYSDSDLPYEHYAPAYGYQLASDNRYDKKNWDEIERQIQRSWESQNDEAWEKVADAVSYGFLIR